MKRFTRIAAILTLASGAFSATAQNAEGYGAGLKMNLNTEGSKYVRFLIWNQVWARSIENNPGTAVNGIHSDNTMDIGLRSSRILAYAQISPRYLILVHFGMNNQTFVNGGGSGSTGTGGYGQGKKPQLFLHDAYNEYAIIPSLNPDTKKANPFSLSLGAGLHYFNGISRMTSASTVSYLMVDAPIFNFPLVENSDQFGRQFGIYIKGAYKKLHYQFSLDKPFATNTVVKDSANVSVDNNGDAAGAISGYADYQFLDQESNLLPYRVGTYIGQKRVFNVGAGFYHEARGTRSSNAIGIAEKHDVNLFGVDAFLDMPVGSKKNNMAITAYAVFYHFDFGPNYLRATSIMNTGSVDAATPAADRVLEGAGNSRVLLGTGSIFYTQAGFLLPKFKGGKVRIQPIASVAVKDMEALKETGTYWDGGANFFLDAHNAKITAQYSTRPLYDASTKLIKDHKGEMIIQFQVAL